MKCIREPYAESSDRMTSRSNAGKECMLRLVCCGCCASICECHVEVGIAILQQKVVVSHEVSVDDVKP